jgi:hypothetical protein
MSHINEFVLSPIYNDIINNYDNDDNISEISYQSDDEINNRPKYDNCDTDSDDDGMETGVSTW